MLTALSLEHFKSWKRIRDMRLAPITGLFGTNSSGKTSILQLLLMLRQTVESVDRNSVLDVGGRGAIVDLGKFRDLIFGHDESRPLDITLDWDLASPLMVTDPKDVRKTLFSGRHIQFRTSIASHKRDRPHVIKMSYELDGRVFEMCQKP